MDSLSLEQIKDNIAAARKQAGITQEEMSKLLGITQPAYSYYEKGDKPIPLNKIKKICEILSIPIKSMIGDIGHDEKDEEVLLKISNSLERIADTLDKICESITTKN